MTPLLQLLIRSHTVSRKPLANRIFCIDPTTNQMRKIWCQRVSCNILPPPKRMRALSISLSSPRLLLLSLSLLLALLLLLLLSLLPPLDPDKPSPFPRPLAFHLPLSLPPPCLSISLSPNLSLSPAECDCFQRLTCKSSYSNPLSPPHSRKFCNLFPLAYLCIRIYYEVHGAGPRSDLYMPVPQTVQGPPFGPVKPEALCIQ